MDTPLLAIAFCDGMEAEQERVLRLFRRYQVPPELQLAVISGEDEDVAP